MVIHKNHLTYINVINVNDNGELHFKNCQKQSCFPKYWQLGLENIVLYMNGSTDHFLVLIAQLPNKFGSTRMYSASHLILPRPRDLGTLHFNQFDSKRRNLAMNYTICTAILPQSSETYPLLANSQVQNEQWKIVKSSCSNGVVHCAVRQMNLIISCYNCQINFPTDSLRFPFLLGFPQAKRCGTNSQ